MAKMSQKFHLELELLSLVVGINTMHHQEMLWALQGGDEGGGGLEVVTEMMYWLHSAPTRLFLAGWRICCHLGRM
jgi:hypothetical protein